MPQVFKIGSYLVYFWVNEGLPTEPIHVHIAEGVPVPNATKVWITKAGKCILANNRSHIPEKALKNIIAMIEADSEDIIAMWEKRFGDVSFYC